MFSTGFKSQDKIETADFGVKFFFIVSKWIFFLNVLFFDELIVINTSDFRQGFMSFF